MSTSRLNSQRMIFFFYNVRFLSDSKINVRLKIRFIESSEKLFPGKVFCLVAFCCTKKKAYCDSGTRAFLTRAHDQCTGCWFHFSPLLRGEEADGLDSKREEQLHTRTQVDGSATSLPHQCLQIMPERK